MKNCILFIIGIGGSGKTKLINDLGLKKLTSYTTRAKRYKETIGEYIHCSLEEFKQKIQLGQMLEYNIQNNNYYGIDKDTFKNSITVNKLTIICCNPKNLIQIIDLCKDVNIIVIHLKCTWIEAIRRMKKRGDNKRDIIKRIKSDKIEFKYIKDIYKKLNINVFISNKNTYIKVHKLLQEYN